MTNHEYGRLLQDEERADTKEFSEDNEVQSARSSDTSEQPKGIILPRTFIESRKSTWMVLLVAFILTSGAMFELGLHWQANIKQSCLDRHVFYSPALEEIEITYRPVQFNGSLDYPSPFRGYPTSEIDAAWDSITELGLMSVSAQQVIESRQSIDSVRFPPEVGDGGYIASVEVAHQLHCLNFLRKQSYFDYYKDKSIEYTDEPATIRDHLDHCIEMLRQTLMCNADIGIIVHEWVEHYPRPYPNFNTWHQCRNFDDIMDWIRGRHIPQKPPNGDEWPKLPGSKTFPTPP